MKVPAREHPPQLRSALTPRGRQAIGISALLFLLGCSSGGEGLQLPLQRDETSVRQVPTRISNDDAPISGSLNASKSLRLTHDLGIVRPMSKVTHTFTVTNPTHHALTLAHIHESCSCTVAEVSRSVIPAGETAKVAVTFSAPNQASDGERTVQISFQEPTAPTVYLTIHASVRPAVTVFPPELDFLEVLPGQTANRTVMVYNYGDTDWSDIHLSTDVKWLAMRMTAAPVLDTKGEQPRQAWRVEATARADSISFGKHRGTVRFEPVSTTDDPAVLPVALEVPLPIRAFPDRLFLGHISDRREIERTIVLKLSQTLSHYMADKITISTTLEPHLSFVWASSQGRFRHLKLTFDPSGLSPGRVEGIITLSFPNTTADGLLIPISGVVSPPPNNELE